MAGNSKDLVLRLRFNAENKEFIGQVKSSAKVVDDLGTKSNKASSGLKSLSKESQAASGDLSSLKSQVLGVAGGFSALAVAINAKDTLGQYQDMRTQITALVGGQEQWLQTEQYLNQVAQEHNKTILDMAQSYARLSVLQEAGLVTQRETMMLFEGMSNAQSQLGATTGQLDQAMYGLSQALASPIVRAEELNQVVEPLPGLLNKLDKAAGLTSGGFRQMMLDGKVTSEFFKTTLIKALADYEGAAARTAQNVNAQQAAFSRSYQQMVLAFEKPISTVFSNSISASVSVLDTFAANADLITDLVGVALFAAMGRGAAAVGTLTAAKLQAVAATRQEIMAEQQKNVVELASIQSEIRHLEVMRATNAQRFAATGAVNALAAAEAREKVVKDALAASQARLNVVMRAGTGLMALLGGPAGIAMMAAGAVGYFALTSNDAKDKTEGFTESIESLLGMMDKLEEKRLEKGLAERLEAVSEVELKIETLSKRKGTNDIKKRLAELAELREEEQKLKQEVIALEDKLYEVRNRPVKKVSGSEDPTEEQEKALKAGERMLENLAKQAALYGNTSEVARVRYEIEKGSLQGINDQLKEQLLLQARIIDQKRAEAEKVKAEKKTDKIDDFFASSDELNNEFLMRLAIQADYENKAKIQEQFAYAERQEQLQAQFNAAYEQARGNQELMHALESEYFQNRQVLRQAHEMNLTEITRQEEEKRRAMMLQNVGFALSSGAQMFDGFAVLAKTYKGEQSNTYRTLFSISKGFAVAQAGLNLWMAISNASAVQPWYAAAAAIASATAQGAGILASLKSSSYQGQAHDGIDRVPAANEGTWLLKANEMVLNPAQADNFRWMVGVMQQMKAAFGAMSASSAGSNYGGGVVVNIHTPAGTQTRQQESVAPDGSKQLDFYIEKAKQATLDAMYQDADNGGPITTRIRASA
ncbi:TPA: tape measure protein [Vibrio parahaemolyticus]|uniref:tape measure protein n=1 Tax=Vibrio parahaemolyticus TaxID=670 RepID=UPI0020610CC6|nr:tape measure protein [Vibrio parahaemolyticus]UPR17295.1 tape measure protein [Vibrio parahaemolyticus]UPR23279.1 tape measure protein [Vibrio parahaemolyticus]HAV1517109.1 tape measure protein [Vibrio parahaemolyticus]HAV1521830.1 tape measure protein [Vibrio parahaemolyticus]HAV1536073.1 tape measure protein [Vibrio parahaemolyticus]